MDSLAVCVVIDVVIAVSVAVTIAVIIALFLNIIFFIARSGSESHFSFLRCERIAIFAAGCLLCQFGWLIIRLSLACHILVLLCQFGLIVVLSLACHVIILITAIFAKGP